MKEHKKIECLMLFSHVAKELNFSRAAENLGISRGHLSEQIKYLERELGTNLLNRSTRHVSLTNEGKQVLACMTHVQSSLTSMERDIHHEKNELKGELKITSPLLFSYQFLNEICDSFHQKNPSITFVLNTSYQNHDLNKHDFDIAFRSTKKPPQDMVAKPLLKYRHKVVVAPSYLKTYGQPKSITDLNNHHCLVGIEQTQWVFKKTQISVKGWLKLNDNFSLLQQTLNGRGIARFPSYFVEKDLKEKNLISLFDNEESPSHQIYLIHPPKIQQSARLKAFLDHVTGYFKQYSISHS